jgi:hypothetical protein
LSCVPDSSTRALHLSRAAVAQAMDIPIAQDSAPPSLQELSTLASWTLYCNRQSDTISAGSRRNDRRCLSFGDQFLVVEHLGAVAHNSNGAPQQSFMQTITFVVCVKIEDSGPTMMAAIPPVGQIGVFVTRTD